MAAQEGSHGHQGTDASNDDNGSARPATDSGTLSQGENSNSGSWSGVPVAEDASKGQDAHESGSAGSSHSGAAGQSKGKLSAAEEAAATDDTDDDISKAGKLGGAAREGKGADRKRKLLPHIITERERRKRMKGMFVDLQALVPHVPEKADKATIVGEAVSFIRELQGTVAKLEKRKQDRALARRAVAVEAASSSSAPAIAAQGSSSDLPQGWAWLPKQPQKPADALAPVGFQTWSGTNVVLSVSKDDAFISVCAPRRAGVMLLVLSVLEKHRVDVVTAQVACDGGRSMFSIHARVNAAAILQLGGEPPASEDIYKLAVSEIMIWLSN